MDINPYTSPLGPSKPSPNVQPAKRFSIRRVVILLAGFLAVTMVMGLIDYIIMLLIKS